MLLLKMKKLHDKAVIPKYSKPGDAGLDLTATETFYEKETGCYVYKTGLAMEIPPGFVGLLFPRSSIAKVSLTLSNSVGVIDSGYRGEVMFKFRAGLGNGMVYEVGERVGQLLVIPYPEVNIVECDELSTTERGTGGYGSTGV